MSDITIHMKDCQVFKGDFKDCVFTMPGVSLRKKEESPKPSFEFVDLKFFDASKFVLVAFRLGFGCGNPLLKPFPVTRV